MEKQIEKVADDFVRALQSTPAVMEYMEALNQYESDKELSNLTEKYYSLSADLQKKQYEGTLTQPEIAELRRLASRIQNNPLNRELAEKQQNVKEILQGCNDSISNEISMDFAKLAAPSSC